MDILDSVIICIFWGGLGGGNWYIIKVIFKGYYKLIKGFCNYGMGYVFIIESVIFIKGESLIVKMLRFDYKYLFWIFYKLIYGRLYLIFMYMVFDFVLFVIKIILNCNFFIFIFWNDFIWCYFVIFI